MNKHIIQFAVNPELKLHDAKIEIAGALADAECGAYEDNWNGDIEGWQLVFNSAYVKMQPDIQQDKHYPVIDLEFIMTDESYRHLKRIPKIHICKHKSIEVN